MATAQVQIANFLNVSPNQIKRCEEWANVYFVQVHGFRPRFVSKKVVKMETVEERLARYEREADELASQATAMAAKIADMLPVGNCADYGKIHSAACDVLRGECTIEEAVARLTSKKVIIKK